MLKQPRNMCCQANAYFGQDSDRLYQKNETSSCLLSGMRVCWCLVGGTVYNRSAAGHLVMGLPGHHSGQPREGPEEQGHEAGACTVQQPARVLQNLQSVAAGRAQSAPAAGKN